MVMSSSCDLSDDTFWTLGVVADPWPLDWANRLGQCDDDSKSMPPPKTRGRRKSTRAKKPVLSTTHKVARGRARTRQLRAMTPAQKDAETKLRLEKNRIAAKLSRAKRKCRELDLERTVERLEKQVAELQRAHAERGWTANKSTAGAADAAEAGARDEV